MMFASATQGGHKR